MAEATTRKLIHIEKAATTHITDGTPVQTVAKVPPSQNMLAFLKLIRFAETNCETDDAYFKLFGPKETFSDTKTHPNKLVHAWGTKSTAAGAYQILKKSYDDAVRLGYMSDFSKESQDSYAICRIKQRGAANAIEKGDLETAINKLNQEWVALPGNPKQTITMDAAKQKFKEYGGKLQE